MKKPLIILFLLVHFWANAQNLNFSFNHFTRENGLSNNNPSSLLIDSRGILWVGTANGLNRFDGSNCRVYKPFNSTIQGLIINNLIEDQNSDLWFSTEAGIIRYIRKTDTFEKFDFFKDKKDRHYKPFYIDNLNRMWFIVRGEGIFAYNPKNKQLSKISSQNIIFAKVSSKLFQEVRNIFFTNNEPGLQHLRLKNDKVLDTKLTFDGKEQPLHSNMERFFYVENDSLVWITGKDFGLTRYNYQKNTFQVFEEYNGEKIKGLSTVSFRPNSMQLFVGSFRHGLLIFDSKSNKFIQQFKHDFINSHSIKQDWVEDIVIDKNQNIFMNMMSWGIDYSNLNTSNSEHWLAKEEIKSKGLPENSITYSYLNKDKIIVRFQQGKVLILDTNGKVLEIKEHYPPIEYILKIGDNTLLACSYEGLYVLDDDFNVKEKIKINGVSYPNESMFSLVETSPNNFVLGSEKGFYELIKKGDIYESKPIVELNKLGFDILKTTYFDKNSQQLFFSSNWWSNFSIAKKVNGQWTGQPLKKLDANVFNIVPDINDKQKIWLCTNMGLLHFDIKTYQYDTWDEAKGLPDNSVTTILPQKNGDFWLITNRGISFYNQSLKVFKNFSEKDGATSSEYDWYGSFYLPDGRMMFAGTDGITVINPKQLASSIPPKIYITDLKINEKSLVTQQYIGESSRIDLKPNENSFSIDFVAIDYSKPDNIRLQYQLQGYDNEWITVKNPANIHLSNVPAGGYVFMIRALADNGQITSEKSLMINIETPFWQTWWFRLLCVLAVVGLTYTFYRYRINQLLKLQAVRNRIATDLHDEIGATLSGIGILSTVAKQQIDTKHPAFPLLGRITDDAQTVGNSIDDIVWSINPKNDELGNIVARMSRHAAELLDAKGIDYQIVTPEKIEDIKMSMEQRREVFLIFKEAINNLIKYAHCKKALIKIEIAQKHFKLTIADDGIGFDTTKISNRNGITNMKNRAIKLKGNLVVESKIGEGTEVSLDFLI